MSFANSSASAEYLVKNSKDLKAQVYVVPEHLDKEIARLKLETMGTSWISLTPAAEHYFGVMARRNVSDSLRSKFTGGRRAIRSAPNSFS